nr:hypothetical protein [Fontimonas thermophila]
MFANDHALRWSMLIVGGASCLASIVFLRAGMAPFRAAIAGLRPQPT